MNYQLATILLLSLIGSVAGLIGGVVFLFKEKWARILCKWAVPFAAGVLISVSLLHLIPEAHHEMGEGAFVVVLFAFMASFLFEQYFAHLHHHEDRKHTMLKSAVPLVLLGDTVHNFIDGVAIAAAYLTDPRFGFVVALATFLHETPHEIGDFGILMRAGWSRRKAFIANLLSALATFPGALFVYFYAQGAHEKIGFLLAVSAGIFLYLGASDFLPEVEEEERKHPSWKNLLPLFIGVLIMYLLSVITPEH
jgi:zinc and cadmium transporter